MKAVSTAGQSARLRERPKAHCPRREERNAFTAGEPSHSPTCLRVARSSRGNRRRTVDDPGPSSPLSTAVRSEQEQLRTELPRPRRLFPGERRTKIKEKHNSPGCDLGSFYSSERGSEVKGAKCPPRADSGRAPSSLHIIQSCKVVHRKGGPGRSSHWLKVTCGTCAGKLVQVP